MMMKTGRAARNPVLSISLFLCNGAQAAKLATSRTRRIRTCMATQQPLRLRLTVLQKQATTTIKKRTRQTQQRPATPSNNNKQEAQVMESYSGRVRIRHRRVPSNPTHRTTLVLNMMTKKNMVRPQNPTAKQTTTRQVLQITIATPVK